MRFSSTIRLFYLLLLFVVLVSAGTAHAFKAGTNPASTSGNRTTFGTGTAGGGNLGDIPFSFASDGTLLSKGPVSFTGGGGLKVDADLVSSIPKQSAGRALARFAMRNTPLLGAALALPDLLAELGFRRSQSPAGDVTLERQTDTASCSPVVAPFPCGGDSSASASWQCKKLGDSFFYGWVNNTSRDFSSCQQVTGTVKSFVPASQQELEDAIAQKSDWPSSSKLSQVLREAIQTGETVQSVPQTLTGPVTSPGVKTTTRNPDGTSTTTTTNHTYTYSGPTVTVTTTTVTQNYTDTGAASGNPTTTTTEPVAEPVKEEKELKVCGLTTDTACKIDETGTKEKTELDPDKKVTDALKQATDFAKTPSSVLPALPQLNWSFRLPTGCVAIALPAFEPYLQSIDVCQFLPMFHDIMGMVWVIGSLFGAISVFWRNVFSMG